MLNGKNHRQHSYAAMGIGLPLDAAGVLPYLNEINYYKSNKYEKV